MGGVGDLPSRRRICEADTGGFGGGKTAHGNGRFIAGQGVAKDDSACRSAVVAGADHSGDPGQVFLGIDGINRFLRDFIGRGAGGVDGYIDAVKVKGDGRGGGGRICSGAGGKGGKAGGNSGGCGEAIDFSLGVHGLGHVQAEKCSTTGSNIRNSDAIDF